MTPLFRLQVCLVVLTLGCSPPVEETPESPFTGTFSVYGASSAALRFHVDGSRAPLITFGSFHIGNPAVFNAGDAYLQDLTRVGFNRWTAQWADLTFEDVPSNIRNWPVAVVRRQVEIVWDENERRWLVGGTSVRFSRDSTPFDGTYDRAGACEKKFVNNNNATIYICEFPQTASLCYTSGEKRFWESRSCVALGYDFYALEGHWRDSQQSNTTPGEHGQWGDRTGGTGTGGGTATGGGSPSAFDGRWGNYASNPTIIVAGNGTTVVFDTVGTGTTWGRALSKGLIRLGDPWLRNIRVEGQIWRAEALWATGSLADPATSVEWVSSTTLTVNGDRSQLTVTSNNAGTIKSAVMYRQ
ncbi:MAG: hypothetical protein IAE78_05975 [Myxococcus sp.]|nr:hypothetical protein [Myxococcus sp.]